MFGVVRNEVKRLSFFLNYYSARRVDRFFIVDNESTDGTTELLLSKDNVHVFRARSSYAQAAYGVSWLETLLRRYGETYWCVVADADEFIVYPGWEHLSIRQICDYMEYEHSSALHCLLVDMYSDVPFGQTQYVSGTDPLAACPYFESDTILCVAPLQRGQVREWTHVGGMRRRLFNVDVRLDKISLIKYSRSMKLGLGMHQVRGIHKSKLRGALFHFKFLADFPDKAQIEASRGEHWNSASEYKRYAQGFDKDARLSAYGAMSRRFRTSKDFLESGVMQCPDEFREYFARGQNIFCPL